MPTESGTLRSVAGRPGRFDLVLAEVRPVTAFTDRPARGAGNEPGDANVPIAGGPFTIPLGS